jgi:hypothetical protein
LDLVDGEGVGANSNFGMLRLAFSSPVALGSPFD